MKKVKVKANKLYLLPSGDLVRAVRVSGDKNFVIFHNYGSHLNDRLDLDVAQKLFIPVFRIGEVANLLGKKPSTLRKYERVGLISEARRFKIGAGDRQNIRLYTTGDIEGLVDFFSRRRGPGPKTNMNYGGVDKDKVMKFIAARYEG